MQTIAMKAPAKTTIAASTLLAARIPQGRQTFTAVIKSAVMFLQFVQTFNGLRYDIMFYQASPAGEFALGLASLPMSAIDSYRLYTLGVQSQPL